VISVRTVAIIRVSILYDEPWLFVCEEHPTNAQLPTLTRPVTPDSCPIYADTRRVAMRGRSIRKDRIERVGWRRDLWESHECNTGWGKTRAKGKRGKITSRLWSRRHRESFSNLVAAPSFPRSLCITSPNKKLLIGRNLRYEATKYARNTGKLVCRYNECGFSDDKFNYLPIVPFLQWNINTLTRGFEECSREAFVYNHFIPRPRIPPDFEHSRKTMRKKWERIILTLLRIIKRERDRGQKVWLPYRRT